MLFLVPSPIANAPWPLADGPMSMKSLISIYSFLLLADWRRQGRESEAMLY